VPEMPKFSPITVIVEPPVRRAKRGMLKCGACLAFSRATSIVSQLFWGGGAGHLLLILGICGRKYSHLVYAYDLMALALARESRVGVCEEGRRF
jgi:hypothetical protein